MISNQNDIGESLNYMYNLIIRMLLECVKVTNHGGAAVLSNNSVNLFLDTVAAELNNTVNSFFHTIVTKQIR